MGVSSDISLLVATLDLAMVQSVLGAIHAADRNSRRAIGDCECPARRVDCYEPRRHLHPTPTIEPRPVLHPTPRYESRPVLHPETRIEARPAAGALIPDAPIIATAKPACESPFQPPWKVLPWQNPPATPIVKIALKRPDIVRKGSLIDCFF